MPYTSRDGRFVIPPEPALVWPWPRIDASQFVVRFDDSFTLWLWAPIPKQLSIKPVRRNRSMVNPKLPRALWASFLIFLLQIGESCPHVALIVLFNEPFKHPNARLVTHEQLNPTGVATNIGPSLLALSDVQRAQAKRAREKLRGRPIHLHVLSVANKI